MHHVLPFVWTSQTKTFSETKLFLLFIFSGLFIWYNHCFLTITLTLIRTISRFNHHIPLFLNCVRYEVDSGKRWNYTALKVTIVRNMTVFSIADGHQTARSFASNSTARGEIKRSLELNGTARSEKSRSFYRIKMDGRDSLAVHFRTNSTVCLNAKSLLVGTPWNF